jgi:hypothetical protein
MPLFARREPTRDDVTRKYGAQLAERVRDTVLYLDRECTQRVVRWPWHYSNCPKKGQRSVVVNCTLHQLVCI